MAKLNRPMPPAEMFELIGAPAFVVATGLEDWARSTFVDDDAPLLNEEHAHLRFARLGFLWTSVANGRHGKPIAGQCEMMPPMAMGKWPRERAIQQIEGWFGDVPDFLITLDANYAAQCDDTSFCALVEHEMLHAGQEVGPFGPKFTKSGRPKFAMRGHCVEEFVSIVARYGVGAAAGSTRQLVEAAKQRPLIGAAQVSQACGTCRLLRAA